MPEPLLSVSELTVTYGQARAVQGIDLEVGPGECVALLGANGAGKSSTLLAISGVVQSRGHIRFDGRDLGRLAPDQIVRAGVVHVPEQRAIFPELTVAENLSVAAYTRKRGGELDADRRLVEEVLPKLQTLRDRRAGLLSGGEQQMLALAKALLMRPRLLLIDELSLGLAPLLVRSLFDVLEEIHQRGVAILLVEQFVPLALRLADRAYVLEKGRVVLSGTAAELQSDSAALAASYMGVTSGVTSGEAPSPSGAQRSRPTPRKSASRKATTRP